MPSPQHDSLGQFFKDDPSLADLPRVTDPAMAAAFPGLAAMSVAVHGGVDVVGAFMDGLKDLPAECRPRHYEYTHKLPRAAARAILEERMHSAPWIVSSPFAREHFGRGKAEGEAETILRVLEARGISVSSEDEGRISRRSDLAQLEKWTFRAATASSIEDVLG